MYVLCLSYESHEASKAEAGKGEGRWIGRVGRGHIREAKKRKMCNNSQNAKNDDAVIYREYVVHSFIFHG